MLPYAPLGVRSIWGLSGMPLHTSFAQFSLADGLFSNLCLCTGNTYMSQIDSNFGLDGCPKWPFLCNGLGPFNYEIVRVARLQSEFCTKDFFRATNFLTKNAPKFSPIFLSLCSMGQKKNPGKFPPNFPLKFPNFPAKNQKKITDELLQERREKKL